MNRFEGREIAFVRMVVEDLDGRPITRSSAAHLLFHMAKALNMEEAELRRKIQDYQDSLGFTFARKEGD